MFRRLDQMMSECHLPAARRRFQLLIQHKWRDIYVTKGYSPDISSPRASNHGAGRPPVARLACHLARKVNWQPPGYQTTSLNPPPPGGIQRGGGNKR